MVFLKGLIHIQVQLIWIYGIILRLSSCNDIKYRMDSNATAVSINLPAGAATTNPLYSAKISITPVVIPAGATYGFYVGGNTTVSYSTTTEDLYLELPLVVVTIC